MASFPGRRLLDPGLTMAAPAAQLKMLPKEHVNTILSC